MTNGAGEKDMADTILDRLEEYTQSAPLAPILFDEVYTK